MALSNFCRGKPHPDYEQVSIAMPQFVNGLKIINDDETINDIVWALEALTAEEEG
jgi:hypothetical protein